MIIIQPIKLFSLNSNPNKFFQNLAYPDVVIKYTSKDSPIVKLGPVSPPRSVYTSTVTSAVKKSRPSLGTNSFGNLLEDSDDELDLDTVF